MKALKSRYQRLSLPELDECLKKGAEIKNEIDKVFGVWKILGRKVAVVKFQRIEQIRAIPIDTHSDSNGLTQKLIEFYENCIIWMRVK